MRDGIIELDSEKGRELGFTSDRFEEGSYLWKEGTAIYISVIASKTPGKGALSTLFKAILEKGYGIRVCSPSGGMLTVLHSKRFQRRIDVDEKGAVECWCLDPKYRRRG